MRQHNAKAVRYVTSHDFDEQLWPINAMLFVFACVVGGVVITAGVKEGRFIDPWLDPQPIRRPPKLRRPSRAPRRPRRGSPRRLLPRWSRSRP